MKNEPERTAPAVGVGGDTQSGRTIQYAAGEGTRAETNSGEPRRYAGDDTRRMVEQEKEKNRKQRRNYHIKMAVLIVLEVILTCLTVTMAYGYAAVQRKWSKVEAVTFESGEIETNSLESEAVEILEGYTTIMFFGVDARDNESLTSDANSDTIIICCIDNETKDIKLVSILRDTFLETSTGKHGKINNHYAAYGVKEALNTINKNFDLMITNYVTVNWKAVAETIDLMGGMDIEMSKDEAKALNQFIWDVIKATGIESQKVPETGGMYHLDGVQTVTYARIRSVGQEDVRRAERQRTVIMLMLEKAKTMDMATLSRIADAILPGISTSMRLNDILSLLSSMSDYNITETATAPFVGHYIDQEGGSYYVYADTLEDNVRMLHELLYGEKNYEPSAYVKDMSKYILKYAKRHP